MTAFEFPEFETTTHKVVARYEPKDALYKPLRVVVEQDSRQETTYYINPAPVEFDRELSKTVVNSLLDALTDDERAGMRARLADLTAIRDDVTRKLRKLGAAI